MSKQEIFYSDNNQPFEACNPQQKQQQSDIQYYKEVLDSNTNQKFQRDSKEILSATQLMLKNQNNNCEQKAYISKSENKSGLKLDPSTILRYINNHNSDNRHMKE